MKITKQITKHTEEEKMNEITLEDMSLRTLLGDWTKGKSAKEINELIVEIAKKYNLNTDNIFITDNKE